MRSKDFRFDPDNLRVNRGFYSGLTAKETANRTPVASIIVNKQCVVSVRNSDISSGEPAKECPEMQGITSAK